MDATSFIPDTQPHPALLYVVVAAPPAVRSPADLASLCGAADLIELRLDLLRAHAPDVEVAAWVAAAPRPVLATVRCAAEGGAFTDGSAAAARLLNEAVAAGAAWLDVEAPVWAHLGDPGASVQLVASHHGTGPAAWPAAVPERAWRKIARPVEDAGAWAALRAEAESAREDPRTFCVPYGALASTRGAFVGSGRPGLLYGSAGDASAVVAGQPPLAVLLDELRAGEVTPDAALYGLVGNPPARSPSPAMHNAVFRGRGQDALYVPLPGVSLQEAMALPMQGLSVTMPFKRDAFEAADELSALARASGSVNTLVRRADGSWLGADTDALAVAASVPKPETGDTACVYGGGGFARSAVQALRSRGYEVRIAALEPEPARALGVPVTGTVYERLPTDRVVVNASPAGADGAPLEAFARASLEGMVVLDAPYGPTGTRTGLVAQANRQGAARIVDGRALLLRQARRQAVEFARCDEAQAADLTTKLQLAVSPPPSLYLLGTRGAGKSTVGRAVAHRLGRPFVDLDDAVTRITGRSPADWIEQDGWTAFREIEHTALERVSARRGIVVALGGGVVDHEPSVRVLREYGVKVLLAVDAATAARRVEGDAAERPRHPGCETPLEEAKALIARRTRIWTDLADHVIVADAAPDEVASGVSGCWYEHAP